MNMNMNIDFKKVHEEALENVNKTMTLFFLKNGDYHGLCGFSWVQIPGVRKNSKLGKQLAEVGFYKSEYEKAFILWNPGNMPTQCIDTKSAAADAYVKTLRSYGIEAYSRSRLD